MGLAHSDAKAKLGEKVKAVEDLIKACEGHLGELRSRKANALQAAASSRQVDQKSHVDTAVAAEREIRQAEARRNGLMELRSFLIGVSDNLIKREIMADLSTAIPLDAPESFQEAFDKCDDMSGIMQGVQQQMKDMNEQNLHADPSAADDGIQEAILNELKSMKPVVPAPFHATAPLTAPRTISSLPLSPPLPEAPTTSLRKASAPLASGLLL